MGTAAEQTVAWLHWEKGNGGSIRHSKRFNCLTEGGYIFEAHSPSTRPPPIGWERENRPPSVGLSNPFSRSKRRIWLFPLPSDGVSV